MVGHPDVSCTSRESVVRSNLQQTSGLDDVQENANVLRRCKFFVESSGTEYQKSRPGFGRKGQGGSQGKGCWAARGSYISAHSDGPSG